MKKTWIYPVFAISLALLAMFVWWYSAHTITLNPATFAQLPGWETTSVKQSLKAFQHSCKTFLKQDPEKSSGNDHVPIKVRDWQPACRAAMALNTSSEKRIRTFFQTWFKPVEFYRNEPVRGLFTGYYMPLLRGSLHQSKEYSVPVYGLPSNLVNASLGQFQSDLKNRRIAGRVHQQRLVPYYTRKEINEGAIRKHAPVLFWINNPMDRVFLEIEGSGVVDLIDGDRMYVGYAGENGAPYTSIASVLIREGILTRNNASYQHIKKYLSEHPDKIDHVLNQNKSFIFFDRLKTNAALGAQGVGLTPGYSMAIDPKWVPYGIPTWLSTTIPEKGKNSKKAFNRLMIAQDTGGAIRGTVRGDVFWGAGENATFMANHMQEDGRYWLLLPKQVAEAISA